MITRVGMQKITLKSHSNPTQIPLNNNVNNDNNLIEIDRVQEICLSNVKWVEAVKRNFLLIRFHEVSYRLN
jgi:hypothetical protein